MENEGYEEDQTRVEEEQPGTYETSNCDQLHAATIDGYDSCIATTTHLDPGHVYEDISTGSPVRKNLEFSETSFSDESRGCESKDLRSPDATKQARPNGPSSIATSTIDRSRNDPMLSPSAGIVADRANPVSSSLATSTASEDDPPGGPPKNFSLENNSLRQDVAAGASSGSTRENEDSTRERAPVQSDRRPNRRRRKKDCKHCRSKLISASSCEKLNELPKDAILRENTGEHLNKDLDVNNLSFREPFLLRSQNSNVCPIVNGTDLRDIDAGKGSAAFHAFSGKRLGNAIAMNDEMSGSNLDKMYHGSNGVLINDIDMRINSIYSQDRWYGDCRELPVFYTDVKDQSAFQVSRIL